MIFTGRLSDWWEMLERKIDFFDLSTNERNQIKKKKKTEIVSDV